MRRSPRLKKQAEAGKRKNLIRNSIIDNDLSSSVSSLSTDSYSYSTYSSSSEEEQMYEIITKSNPSKVKNKPILMETVEDLPPKKKEKRKTKSKKKKIPSPTLLLQVQQPNQMPITEIPRRFEFSFQPPPSPKHRSPTKNDLKLVLEERNIDNYPKQPQKDELQNFQNFVIESPSRSRIEHHNQNTRNTFRDNHNRNSPEIAQNHVKTMIPKRHDSIGLVYDIPSSESSEPFTKDAQILEFSKMDHMQMFLFNIYEEGNKLFLFGKYKADPTQFGTVCVLINHPTRSVQFLPKQGKINELKQELLAMFGKSLVSIETIWKKNFNDSDTKEWVECTVDASFDLTSFPMRGQHYQDMKGFSASLAENFLLKNKIKGCRWINIQCTQSFTKHTVIPFFICKSPEKISVEEESELANPSMNICVFSLMTHNCGSGKQIYMISTRIFFQWDYEKFDDYEGLKSGHKISTFVLSQGEKNRPKKESTSTVYCNTEKELLVEFFNYIEHYDIDILCSYDLIEKDLPILLSKSQGIPESILLGRFHRIEMTTNVFNACAGRVLLDIKKFYKNILSVNSTSLSSLVSHELNSRIPIINDSEVFDNITQLYQWNNLIGYSRKETSLIQQFLETDGILAMCFTISRITNSQLQTIMQGDFIRIIEDQLTLALFRTNFIIPDRFKKDFVEPLESQSFLQDATEAKIGQAQGMCALFECNNFFASIVMENNICFTTDAEQKRIGIVPSLLKEYSKTINRIKEKNVGEGSEDPESRKKKFNIKSLMILTDLFERFFVVGSKRYNVIEVRNRIKNKTSEFVSILTECISTSIPCIIWSDNNRFFVSSSLMEHEEAYIKFSSFAASFNKGHKKLKLDIKCVVKRPIIISPFSFICLDEEQKIMTERNGSGFNGRADWTEIECSLYKNIILSILKADDDSEACEGVKAEIEKTFDMLKKESVKNIPIDKFGIPFYTWKVCNDNAEIFNYINDIKKRGLMDFFEDRVSICLCRDNIPIIPANVQNCGMLDTVLYKNRLLDVIAQTLSHFPSILTEVKAAKLAPQNEGNLSVICPFCFAKVPFFKMGEDNKCPLCGSLMHWKYVANNLVKSIRNIITEHFANGNKCNAFLCKCLTLQIPLQGSSSHIDPCDESRECRGIMETTSTDMNPYDFFAELSTAFNGSIPMDNELQEFMNDYIKKVSSLYGIDISTSERTTSQCTQSSQLDICSFLSQ